MIIFFLYSVVRSAVRSLGMECWFSRPRAKYGLGVKIEQRRISLFTVILIHPVSSFMRINNIHFILKLRHQHHRSSIEFARKKSHIKALVIDSLLYIAHSKFIVRREVQVNWKRKKFDPYSLYSHTLYIHTSALIFTCTSVLSTYIDCGAKYSSVRFAFSSLAGCCIMLVFLMSRRFTCT